MSIFNAVEPDFLAELPVCPSCKMNLQMQESRCVSGLQRRIRHSGQYAFIYAIRWG